MSFVILHGFFIDDCTKKWISGVCYTDRYCIKLLCVMEDSRKRDREESSSSEGTSLVHIAKQQRNMADGDQQGDVTLQAVLAAVEKLQKGQEAMKTSLERKIDSLRIKINKNITKKLGELKNEIYVDIEKLQTGYDELKTLVDALPAPSTQRVNSPLHDSSVCVIASKGHYSPTENLPEKVNKLIGCLDDDVSSQVVVTGCERLKQRNPAYKPLVKIAFASLEQKIMVLRAKNNLEQHMEFGNVWLRGAKDHVERLIDINFNTVIKIIPAGNGYKVSGSGRIIKKRRP